MLIEFAGGEGMHGGGDGVVTQQPRQAIDERRLAGAAVTIDEHQGVIAGEAGEAIADPPLEKSTGRRIVACRLVEETQPQRAIGGIGWSDGGGAGDIVLFTRHAALAGGEIDRAYGRS
jgi:hypothetical protein